MHGSRHLRLFVLFLFLAAPLAADTLELRNGRKLSGRVVRQDARNIYFRGDDGKTATFPKSRVRRIRYGPVPDPAAEKRRKAAEARKQEAERKRKEALRKKREAARRAAAEKQRKAAEARKREQERIAREKREQAERKRAARERLLLQKQQAEARRAKNTALRQQRAAERARAQRDAAAAREEEQKRLAEEKRQREEEERLRKELETVEARPEKKEEQAPPAAESRRTAADSTGGKGGFVLEAGLAAGQYDPDTEARFRADKFLSTLFNTGGLGLQTAWKRKSFVAVPIYLGYEWDRWSAGARVLSPSIRPRFVGYFNADNVGIPANANSDITEIESVAAESYTRDQFTVLGRYEAYRSDPVSVFLTGGIRSVDFSAVIVGQKFSRTRTTSFLSQFNASVTGNISELSREQATYTAQAGGPVIGISARYRLGPAWEIDLGVRQYSLGGETRMLTEGIKMTESRVKVSVGSVDQFSTTNKGELFWRLEQGKLAITGREWTTGVFYKLNERRKLFFQYARLTSAVGDSDVKVWLLNTNPETNPYTVELDGESLYLRDLKFSYPGSVHGERLRYFSFGLEEKF